MPVKTLTVKDRLDIQDLLATYAWAIDSGDIDGVVALFTKDGRAETASAKFDDARKFATYFIVKRKEFRGRQHIIANTMIRGNGTRCTVKSFMLVVKWDSTTDQKAVVSIGTYTDTCVKQRGKWLFKERLVAGWNDKLAPWIGPSA